MKTFFRFKRIKNFALMKKYESPEIESTLDPLKQTILTLRKKIPLLIAHNLFFWLSSSTSYVTMGATMWIFVLIYCFICKLGGGI